MSEASSLLAAYDRQVRTAMAAREPSGVNIDWDGPLLRGCGMHRGFVNYRDLGRLTGADLDALIARTWEFFAERGESFEWKTHSHDEPADLPARLLAAGFVAEEAETVLIGSAEGLATDPVPPAGVHLEEVTAPPGFAQIAAMHSEIWGEDWSWLAEDLASRRDADPEDLTVLAALAEDGADADAEAGAEPGTSPRMVSAGWLVRNPGTEFAGLWGGSTLAQWRGRGIYRALIARRAQLAVGRGVRYLQVDSSADSAPILRRLGFLAVTTTTPYVWTPAKLAASTLGG